MSGNRHLDLAEVVSELCDIKQENGSIKEFHEDILENIIEGVWVSNKKDEIFYANKGMGKIYGIKPYQIIGKNALSGFPETTLKYFRQYYIRARVTLNPVYYHAISVITPAGRQSYQSGWLVPRAKRGKFDGMICTVEDITERKAAEEKLKASVMKAEDEKAKAEAVIAAIGDGIIIQDTDFKIIYQNEIQNKLYGHHLGEYCYEVYEGQDTVCEGCPVELTFKDGKVHKTERRIATDQGTMYFELTSSPLSDSSGKIIAGVKVVRDITKQKMAEVSLLESNQYWGDTFDTITDMITIHDKDFNIVKSNKAAQKILGLPDLELNKITKCYKYYHGTGTAPKGCPSCNCLKTGKSAAFDIYEAHLDMYLEVRAMPRFDNNNNLIGLIHVVRDITGRKRIEESHNKLLEDVTKGKLEWEMTFDTVTELIILIDKDFNIVRCNMSFAAFAGVKIDTLIGRKCYEYFSPCDPEQLDHCKALVLKGEPMTRVEINTKNGRWFYVSHRPIMDKKGEFIHSVIIASDITELKNTQGKLIESEKELKRQVEDLEKFYDMAVGRELKMKDLKKEIKKLKAELSACGHNIPDD